MATASARSMFAGHEMDFRASRPARFESPVQRNFEILRRIELFQDAPSAEVLRLAEVVRVSSYPKGVLVNPGLADEQVAIVAAGNVKRSIPRGEGNHLLLGVLGAGDVVSEAALSAGIRGEPVETVALSAVVVVQIPRTSLQQVLDRCGLTASRFLAATAARLVNLTDMMARLSGLEVPERFYLRIVELAWKQGRWKRDGLTIEHGQRQTELAESIGASRESVNRQLAAWREQGLVSPSARRLVVVDPMGLSYSVSPGVRRPWPPRNTPAAVRDEGPGVVHFLARGCDIG